MKWHKIDFIFNLNDSKLSNLLFAQSPQAVVIDDYVRVFFSTRKLDKSKKYVSVIGFVDYDINWNIINLNTDNIIELGQLGEFDEHGIFPISPVKIGDEIWAYTTGWSRRVSVSVETSIGLAISNNKGLNFHKIGSGGPIISNSYLEPMLVGDAFVRRFNDTFYMWYIFGTEWISPTENEPEARVYKIAQATSKDGFNWVRGGNRIIKDTIINECQALPTVIKIDDTFHMYFCFRYATDFRKNSDKSYKIGYAYSKDLLNWNRDDLLGGIMPTKQSWDSDMLCYPNIFEWNDKIYLLYNGNEFGKFGFGVAELIHT